MLSLAALATQIITLLPSLFIPAECSHKFGMKRINSKKILSVILNIGGIW